MFPLHSNLSNRFRLDRSKKYPKLFQFLRPKLSWCGPGWKAVDLFELGNRRMKDAFQGELLYGFGGNKLYQYSIFKPLEGYFK